LDEYYGVSFGISAANGCYKRIDGGPGDFLPVYSNGTYSLRASEDPLVPGPSGIRWYIQEETTKVAHYWSESGSVDPVNDNIRYNATVGAGPGGYIELYCPDSESSSISTNSDSSGTSSSSISSSTAEGTTSSSSIADNILSGKSLTYLSNCRGSSSITNPMTGEDVEMSISGHLNETGLSIQTVYENPKDGHVEKGGLEKTSYNSGRIFCEDAGRLFSSGQGMVSVRLSLPYAVSSGIYSPLESGSGKTLTDMVIWGVNFGDVYITPPGLYAAFTPAGIEFTVWTEAGKITILDTSSNLEANEDIVMEFAWHEDGIHGGRTVVLAVNGVETAWSTDPLVDDSFSSMYSLKDLEGAETFVSASFSLMDSPSGKNGLLGTIRRIETYSLPSSIPSGATGRSIRAVLTKRSEVGLEFSLTGTKGGGVEIMEPEFPVTMPIDINLLSVGDVGVARNKYGEDEGKADGTGSYPEAPKGLPVGFEEVRPRQQ
jgi:hypothetical protein